MKILILPDTKLIEEAIRIMGPQVFPSLSKSIERSANMVFKEWKKKIDSASSPQGFKKKYKESIRIEEHGPLEKEVKSESMFGDFVEEGIKRFSMKPGLLNGPKAKVNKQGKKYTTIFFRKGVPGSKGPTLPRHIYKEAIKLHPGEKLRGFEHIGTRSDVRSRRTIKTGTFEGLTKVGQPKHTQYGTFRRVTQDSPGWIYPGIQKSPVFEKLVGDLRSKIIDNMQEGLKKDLEDGFNTVQKRVGP